MEEGQEQRHVCKVCNKSFLSGKVLGGHMRSHAHKISSKKDQELRKDNMGSEFYGLRENPKKSWKSLFPDDDHISAEEGKKVCKACGKSFDSLKALFGHMRHHSGKQKKPIPMNNDCEKHSNSFDHFRPVRRKRSYRIRLKADSHLIGSSSPSFTEIEPEMEEIAVSLLMLSKGFYSATEKVKSLNHVDPIVKLSPYVKKDSEFSGSFSGFSTDEEDKIGFQVPIKKFYRDVEYKMPELDDHSETLLFDTEIEKELDEDSMEQVVKLSPRKKKARFDDSVQLNNENSDSENLFDESWKKLNEFQCKICERNFNSYQALGGHCTIHKKTEQKGVPLKIENGEKKIRAFKSSDSRCSETNSMDRAIGEAGPMSYGCPICFKVFGSGKALGGHKRAHIGKETLKRAAQGIEEVDQLIGEMNEVH